MSSGDPDEVRGASREAWEQAAPGWGRVADRIHAWAVGVSATMVDALALQPGDRVLELAAGPGDTGFMAAELIAQPDDGGAARSGEAGRRAGGTPPGRLICSDGAEAMLTVARERAAAQAVHNVEFRQLELEWIDLPTADVDAVLCRWGIMLIVDSDAAAREIRRVLRPGGRAALAVWDVPERNPWTTIPARVMRELGHVAPPEDDGGREPPGMFKLAGDGVLAELLHGAGLVDVKVAAVAMARRFPTLEEYVAEMIEMAASLRTAYEALTADQQDEVRERIGAEALPYTADDGSLTLPGSSLVASAAA